MCMHDRVPTDMGPAFTEIIRGPAQPCSSLPDDVIEIIFAMLPLQAKLVCKCVCRSWKSILSADSLLTHTTNTGSRCRKASSSNARFMLTTRGPFAYTLDPLTNFWHTLKKPACPGASVLAASHGLICVGNQVSECRALIIFNLLSNTWRILPNMLRVGLLHKVTMAVDESSHSYVVVVTGEDTSQFRGSHTYRLHTEVYHSVSACWRKAGDALPEAKFGCDPGVWRNGLFYCITEMPYGLTAFSLAAGQWMELSVEMPIGILHPSLVICKGRLMMVGIQEGNAECVRCAFDAKLDFPESPVMEQLPSMPYQMSRSFSWSGPLQMWVTSQLGSTRAAWPSMSLPLSGLSITAPLLSSLVSLRSSPPRPTSSSPSPPSPVLCQSPPQSKKCIRIWTLKSCNQWMKIEEMPEELCKDFMMHLTPKTRLVCAGVGDDICISSHQSPNTVIFNVNSMEWRRAASDPLFPRNRDTHLLGFAVQPDAACVP